MPIEEMDNYGLETKDLHWLAGWLEGEGSFFISSNRKSPVIVGGCNDKDIIDKIACLIKAARIHGPYMKAGYTKPFYQFWLIKQAVSWMMMLYPLMGERRKNQIRKCLSVWKSVPCRSKTMKEMWERGIFDRMVVSHRGSGNCNSHLTEEQVLSIRQQRSVGASMVELARQFSVTTSNVCHIINRRTWTHV